MTAIGSLAAGVKISRSVTVRAGCFKYPVGSHFVFYRQSDYSLDVVRILHQRMDADVHL